MLISLVVNSARRAGKITACSITVEIVECGWMYTTGGMYTRAISFDLNINMAPKSCSNHLVSASSTQHQSNSQFELSHLFKASLQLQLQHIQSLRAYQITPLTTSSNTHQHNPSPFVSNVGHRDHCIVSMANGKIIGSQVIPICASSTNTSTSAAITSGDRSANTAPKSTVQAKLAA